MDDHHPYHWARIDDIPSPWSSLANPQVGAVVTAWLEKMERLREQDAFKVFLEKLRRRWAIETGILERLYTLSDGATQILIERGLDASLISHEDTNDSPEHVVAMIRDQKAAIDGLFQFVSSQRPLGISYIQ